VKDFLDRLERYERIIRNGPPTSLSALHRPLQSNRSGHVSERASWTSTYCSRPQACGILANSATNDRHQSSRHMRADEKPLRSTMSQSFIALAVTTLLTLSPPIPLRLYILPYWSKPPFLIFDIRSLWCSVVSARAPECQKLKMVS